MEKKLERKLKAFEIIMEKSVNVVEITQCESADEYNSGKLSKKRHLTEDEFKFLLDLIVDDYYWTI